jgi:uncharacterized protein YegL
MPKIEDGTKNARKILPIIYVIDTSGSMAGTRIAAVNQAMNETIDVLKEVSDKNPTAELKIGVLQFASGASWVTNEDQLVFMDDFYWNDLTAGGITDLGAALDELYIKMSRSAFFNEEVGYKVPVLIFMSDGGPTDDYKSALKKITDNNKWFKVSTKICLAIDEDSDVEVLQEIAGCGDKDKGSESVIQVSDMETLKKLIRVVSVTASMIGAKSRTDSDNTSETVKVIKGEMEDTGGVSIPDEPNPTPEPVSEPDSDDPWGSGVEWD